MDSSVGSRCKRSAAEGNGRREVIPYLPDDILTNILSWLPAYDVLRCRCVCRGWRDLTSTQEFVDIHLNRQFAEPLILDQKQNPILRKDGVVVEKPYFIDTWWEPSETRRKPWLFADFLDYDVLLSIGGLIILRQFPVQYTPQLIILNPTNGESLMIKLPKRMLNMGYFDQVYGVFFHPSLKEYCTLWGSPGPLKVRFKLLVMGSLPYLRNIGNPLGDKGKAFETKPILVNGNLYWIGEPEVNQRYYDIIEFDVKSEKFILIPSPVPREICSWSVAILNIDGQVSVVKFFVEKLLTIWTLKDHPGKSWSSTSYSFSNKGYCRCKWPIVPISYAKGVLFCLSGGKIYVCNLKYKTMRCVQNVNFKGPDKGVSHVMTTASLRKCKSQIAATERTEGTSKDQIQIIWEQLSRVQPQGTLG